MAPKVKTQRLGPSFSRPKNELRSEIARSLAYDHTTYLLQDIAAAQNLGAPLGATNKFHRRILASTNYEITEAEVAFHINLPILHGVEPEVLYKLREDEKEHFQAFRNSLKTAIRERLDRIGEQDAESIGEEIRQDVIEPSLNEIDRRLNLARKALAKKATTSVVVGALATTCGLLTANPIMVSTGVGATMTALPATHKYIEERRDVTLSDMYFLWNAKRHIQERR